LTKYIDLIVICSI